MAQATNPKIEELRFRIKTDPKSRLFFPLAEELRKVAAYSEAESVLRTGLEHHPTYLSAWVSLGRVLRDEKNEPAAIEALSKALQLDPGNVVAARLLADAYLAHGEKLEALKKYKLVHALMPSDSDLEGVISRIEEEINPTQIAAPEPEAAGEAAFAPPTPEEESPWADAATSLLEEHRVEEATADNEPMSVAHEESPFEEPAPAFTTAALEVEAPEGMHVGRAPMEAEVPLDMTAELPMVDVPPIAPAPASDVADVFAPAEEQPREDITSTLTMADLYAGQGLVADARQIYETILLRDPNNDAVREKLAALDRPQAAVGRDPKVAKLEAWLAKIGRREVSRV
ncbi:MAG TPA: tetratricopeptide repeat protein [Thermoanaerobaculia bacterium]|jgi:tetratricopeptide (TPR) repeat protein|nr:tetratricopeptide repeat protein [Thermoanaerobaculia bacterium]